MENTAADGRSAIFGAAQPVDTAAREMEIEQKLMREKERAAKEEEVGIFQWNSWLICLFAEGTERARAT